MPTRTLTNTAVVTWDETTAGQIKAVLTGTFSGASEYTFDNKVAINTTTTNIVLNGSDTTIPLSVYGTVFANTLQRRHSDTAAAAPGLYFARSRGSLGSETVVSADDRIVSIVGIAHDGTDYANVAQIFADIDATPGSDDMPGRWRFLTCPDGSQTPAEALRIDSVQAVLAKSATGGIGYGSGAGGAVAQITSRTTGVTLNTVCGAITLVSAAGSTSWQTFTVTNSAVAATDNVHVSQKSGTDLNEIHVTAVAAGSFNISFRTTGGTTTEQPVFKYTIIKAVEA